MDVWSETEAAGCEFPDERLKHRFSKLLSALSQKVGDSIPTACQDWAATKAANRFFDNRRVRTAMENRDLSQDSQIGM